MNDPSPGEYYDCFANDAPDYRYRADALGAGAVVAGYFEGRPHNTANCEEDTACIDHKSHLGDMFVRGVVVLKGDEDLRGCMLISNGD